MGSQFLDEFEIFKGTFNATKKPIKVNIDIADTDGVINTLEGAVQYKAGDGIVTGVEGEKYPVPQKKLPELYNIKEVDGKTIYEKKPIKVRCWATPFTLGIKLDDARGTLRAKAGDIVVKDKDNYYVVDKDIFDKTFTRD